MKQKNFDFNPLSSFKDFLKKRRTNVKQTQIESILSSQGHLAKTQTIFLQ